MAKFIRHSCKHGHIQKKTLQIRRPGFLVPNRPMYPWEIIAVDFIDIVVNVNALRQFHQDPLS